MEFSRRSRRVSRAFNPVSPISAAAAARSFAQLEADENDDAVQFCAGDKSEPACGLRAGRLNWWRRRTRTQTALAY